MAQLYCGISGGQGKRLAGAGAAFLLNIGATDKKVMPPEQPVGYGYAGLRVAGVVVAWAGRPAPVRPGSGPAKIAGASICAMVGAGVHCQIVIENNRVEMDTPWRASKS